MNAIANLARPLVEKIAGVEKTPEFLEIMKNIDREIQAARNAGKRYIGIISYTLMDYNRIKFPSFVDRNKISAKTFWWPYVSSELETRGFKISRTNTLDHYVVEW
jgi:hypothetical protein